MKCPCCNKDKMEEDFYWRGFWKVHKECKKCLSEMRVKKITQEKNITINRQGYFNVEEFGKLYNW